MELQRRHVSVRRRAILAGFIAAKLILDSVSGYAVTPPSDATLKSFKSEERVINTGEPMANGVTRAAVKEEQDPNLKWVDVQMKAKVFPPLTDQDRTALAEVKKHMDSMNRTLAEEGRATFSESQMQKFAKVYYESFYLKAAYNQISSDLVMEFILPAARKAFKERISIEEKKVKDRKISESSFKNLKERYNLLLQRLNKCTKTVEEINDRLDGKGGYSKREDGTPAMMKEAKRLEEEIASTRLGKLYHSPEYGQAIEHANMIKNVALTLALNLNLEAVLDVREKVRKGLPVNLQDYGLADRPLFYKSAVEDLPLAGLYNDVCSHDKKGKVVSNISSFVDAVNKAQPGKWESKDPVPPSVDAVLSSPLGIRDPALKAMFGPGTYVAYLKNYAETGRVTKMYDPELGRIPMFIDEKGKPNERAKLYGSVKAMELGLYMAMISDLNRYSDNPMAILGMPLVARRLGNVAYNPLIGGVSVPGDTRRFDDKVATAKEIYRLLYYALPQLYVKSSLVIKAKVQKVLAERRNALLMEDGKPPQWSPDDIIINLNEDGQFISAKDRRGKIKDEEIYSAIEEYERGRAEIITATFAAALTGKGEISIYGFGDVTGVRKTTTIETLISQLLKKEISEDGFRASAEEVIRTVSNEVQKQFILLKGYKVEGKGKDVTYTPIENPTVRINSEGKLDLRIMTELSPSKFLLPKKTNGIIGVIATWEPEAIEGIPFPMKARSRLLDYSFNDLDQLPKDGRLHVLADILPQMEGKDDVVITAEAIGSNFSRYSVEMGELSIPAPESIPMEFPSVDASQMSLGVSGIGGEVAGMDTRAGSEAIRYLRAARQAELAVGRGDYKSWKQLNQSFYQAVEASYRFDSVYTGGSEVRAWLDANSGVMQTGEFKTRAPNALSNGGFGTEMSYVFVDDPVVYRRVSHPEGVKLRIGLNRKAPRDQRWELIVGGGRMVVTEFMRSAKVTRDSNGDPVIDWNQTQTGGVTKTFGMGRLGFVVPIRKGVREEFEVMLTEEGEKIFRAAGLGDKSFIAKFKSTASSWIQDWNDGIFKSLGRNLGQSLNLLEEIEFKTGGPYGKGWVGSARVMPIKLKGEFLGLPRWELDYHYAFTVKSDAEGIDRVAMSEDFNNALRLQYKGKKFKAGVYDIFHRNPAEPTAIGLGLMVPMKGTMLMPSLMYTVNPDVKSLDLFDLPHTGKLGFGLTVLF